jgi:hypothetical protein
MDWKTPRLNKGQFIACLQGNTAMSVQHVDRTIDPYLAGVIVDGRIVYSGLHATLADARSTCTRKARELQ